MKNRFGKARDHENLDAGGARPDTVALLAELTTLAEQHKQEGDALRRLPPALAEAFRRNDIYRLILPRDLGGREMDPLDYLHLVEGVAAADGSTAWNLSIGIGSALFAGYLPVVRSRSIFADADCGIAGLYAPVGRGEPVEGGYRVSGRWGWASGIDHARWVVFGFTVEQPASDEAEGSRREALQALAPREAFRVLDTWYVSGMRGTGSTDYEAEDLFVPADMTFRMFRGEPQHPAPLFRLPGAFFGAAIAVIPLGIARGAAEGLKRLATTKQPMPGRTALPEQAFAQYAVAKAEALTESASLYLHQAIADIWCGVLARKEADLQLRARARRACVHAAEVGAEAVDLCGRAAGGTALFESQPFERAQRDVRAALGHFVVQRNMMEDAGRVSFGFEPRWPVF